MDGWWTWWHPNGRIKTSGVMRGGKRNGLFRRYSDEGAFRDARCYTDGVIRWTARAESDVNVCSPDQAAAKKDADPCAQLVACCRDVDRKVNTAGMCASTRRAVKRGELAGEACSGALRQLSEAVRVSLGTDAPGSCRVGKNETTLTGAACSRAAACCRALARFVPEVEKACDQYESTLAKLPADYRKKICDQVAEQLKKGAEMLAKQKGLELPEDCR